MDEASKLVGELQQKLSELDLKLWRYRQDMVAEFEKYTEDLLRDVPKDVFETVSKTMTEAMKHCTALYSTKTAKVESSTTGTSILENNGDGGLVSPTQILPIPSPPRRPAEDMELSPRSPHEREKEFQGVFTPSYLPLLDSTSRSERRLSHDHSPTSPSSKGKERDDEPIQVDASTDTRSLMNTPETNRPPTPSRRNTDEWSIGSDHSDGIRRRSALRRSSNASNKDKGSPRRVRFEVAGIEVLPTSSPQPESAMNGDGPTSLFSDEIDDEAGSEIIGDVEQPPPKRISSSQALRILSRTPLADDGTQWTAVTAPPDGSASVATASGISENSSSEDLYMSNGTSQLHAGNTHNGIGSPAEIVPENVASITRDRNLDSKASLEVVSEDDEDMLAMPPRRRHVASQAANMLSPANPPSIVQNTSSSSATRPNKAWQGMDNIGLGGKPKIGDLKFGNDEDDDLFHFDEALESGTPHTGIESPPQDHDDEERDSFDTETSIRPTEHREILPSKYSYDASSPARPIMNSSQMDIDAPIVGAVGSYRGHPFSMPIVSPDVHAQAASFGPLNSFVGSVNGRSGLDESDIQSFRASVGSFSGTPRSMSERFMMEQVMEAEKNPKFRRR